MRKSVSVDRGPKEDPAALAILLCDVRNLYRNILKESIEKYLDDRKVAGFYVYDGFLDLESVADSELPAWLAALNGVPSVTVLANAGKEIVQTESKIQALRDLLPLTKIIVISETENRNLLFRCIMNGVVGYMLSDVSVEALVDCVKLVANGQTAYPSHLFNFHEIYGQADVGAVDPGTGDTAGPLGAKEVKILGYLASGFSNKEISRAMNMPEPTAKLAVRQLLARIGAKNRVQAAVWAAQNGYARES